MSVPTKEAYEKALESRELFVDWIKREKNAREKLINDLCTSQSCLNNYEALLSNVNDVIQKYEIYQDICKEKCGAK